MIKKNRKDKKHGSTEQTKNLIASLLAKRIGALQIEDFPGPTVFEGLPTRSYGPHKIIRCRKDELFIVRRGLVEVWHTHHDLLIKRLTAGTLFGEMPLLGQTMVTTQALASDAGATVTVMSVEQVEELITANPLLLAAKLYPLLASLTVEHYRTTFQQVGSRLAALLLELAGNDSVVIGITQQQMGERIGTVRETVTVALTEMKLNRLIAIERMKTTILDRKGLEELSRM